MPNLLTSKSWLLYCIRILMMFACILSLSGCTSKKEKLTKIANDQKISNDTALVEIANILSKQMFPNAKCKARAEKKNTDTFALYVTVIYESPFTQQTEVLDLKSCLTAAVAKEGLRIFQFGSDRKLDEVVISVWQRVVKWTSSYEKFPQERDLENIEIYRVRLNEANLKNIPGWKAVPFEDKRLGSHYGTLKSVVEGWSTEVDNFAKIVVTGSKERSQR